MYGYRLSRKTKNENPLFHVNIAILAGLLLRFVWNF